MDRKPGFYWVRPKLLQHGTGNPAPWRPAEWTGFDWIRLGVDSELSAIGDADGFFDQQWEVGERIPQPDGPQAYPE